MIDRIYSCKMYKNSKNKDQIVATLQDPTNAELLVQLQSYLDPQYRKKKKPDKQGDSDPDIEFKVNDDDVDETDPVNKGPEPTRHPFPPAASFSSNHPDDTTSTDPEPQPTAGEENTDDPVNQDNQNDDVTSSISASTVIETLQPDSIKGLLNSSEDTSGVNRILVKGEELWIYYEDKKNLNNIMGPAIELLNSANYACLEFNRLARTDNAIVFQIYPMLQSTTQVGEKDE